MLLFALFFFLYSIFIEQLFLFIIQIIPAGTMPTLTKKYHGNKGKLVIINLQPTKQDKKADLIIRAFADSVMTKLMKKFGLEIPDYDSSRDPIVSVKSLEFLDWTQTDEETKRVVGLAEKIEAEFKENRKQNRKTRPKTEAGPGNGSEAAVKPEVKIEEPDEKVAGLVKVEAAVEAVSAFEKRKNLEDETDSKPENKFLKLENGS